MIPVEASTRARLSLSVLVERDAFPVNAGLTGRWSGDAVWKLSLPMFVPRSAPTDADRMPFSRQRALRIPISGRVQGSFASSGTTQKSPFAKLQPGNAARQYRLPNTI